MNNFPPVPPNPKRPKTPYEKSVQIAGITFVVFFILLAIGNTYFLTSPLVNLSDIAKIFLFLAECIFMLIGTALLAIFMEN